MIPDSVSDSFDSVGAAKNAASVPASPGASNGCWVLGDEADVCPSLPVTDGRLTWAAAPGTGDGGPVPHKLSSV